MFKQLLVLVCAALVTMLMVNPVNAQESPPTSEKAKQIEALVNKAAALIESKGKAIFSEFRKKDSEWFHGDTYLFVYDLKSNVLFNAAFPAREGTNTPVRKMPMASYFITNLFRWLNPRDRVGSTTCSRNQGRPNRRGNGPT